MREEYGNNISTLRRLAIFGLVLGVITVCVAVVFGEAISGEGIRKPKLLIPLALMPALVLVVAAAPSLMFKIRLNAGHVQHVALGRFILSSYLVDEFRRLDIHAHGCAAVIRFRAGSIHWFAAHLSEVARLGKDLSSARHGAQPAVHGLLPQARS